MGGERASKVRMKEAGKICHRCGIFLPELPGWVKGERSCEKCQPRPHQVVMNFTSHNAWDVSFLEADGRTPLGQRFDIPSDREFFALVERAMGDVRELEQKVQKWGKGTLDLRLTDEQYRRLKRRTRRQNR